MNILEISRLFCKKVNESSKDSLMFCQVGTSLFASNVGSGHFIGLAGSAAAAGIGPTAYEWNVKLQELHVFIQTQYIPCKIVGNPIILGMIRLLPDFFPIGDDGGSASRLGFPPYLHSCWGERACTQQCIFIHVYS